MGAFAQVSSRRIGLGFKRILDIAGSAILLVFFSPLIMVLFLSVLIWDGSPVFHRRRVVGPAGEFDAFKLRTMQTDADEVLRRNPDLNRQFEKNFKLENDPRVTRLGAFLRKTSMDELPQLWNVLKGQMSLVGPRMVTFPELEKYGEASWVFCQWRPGITGYWQVHGRQTTNYEDRIEMDLFYVRHWSLLLDLKILWKTPLVVIRGVGAH